MWVAAHIAGLHTVPCVPGSKRPAGTWRKYMTERPPVGPMLGHDGGIVTGAAGVEAIDFDAGGLLLDTYLERLEDADSGLASRVYIERSPSGGAHIIYRCPNPEGNQVLADCQLLAVAGPQVLTRGRATYPLRVAQDLKTWECLGSGKSYQIKNGIVVVRAIETRGTGGYLVTAPSTGYVVVQGGLDRLPLLSDDERNLLISIARGLHERIEGEADKPAAAPAAPAQPAPTKAAAARRAMDPGITPGDDYSETGDHAALLSRNGWVFLGEHGDNENWGRPGGEAGKISATWSLSKRVMFVFSTSTSLPVEQGLRLFAVRAILEFRSDYSATTKALRGEGFGGPSQAATAAGVQRPLATDSLPGGVGVSDEAAGDDEPRDYELHQRGNALRFFDEMGQDVRYCHTWEQWLVWSGTHWERDDKKSIPRLMAEAVNRSCLAQRDRLFAQDMSKKAIEVERWRIKNQNTQAIKHSIEAATSLVELSVTADDMDQDPWLFSAQNGTIDLRTATMREHRREDLITRCCPIPYQSGAHDPRWEDFLAEVTAEDADLMAYIQRAAGYSMSGSVREQVVFLMYGSGGTGKGTLVSALANIMGNYAAAVNFEVFLQGQSSKNWSLAKISQARMVMCEESKAGQRLADDVFKRVTGGTEVEAEAKYSNPFSYLPKYKIWLVTNSLPRTSDTDDAVWRRMQVVTFNQKPKTKNKDLGDIFKNDPSCQAAILAWMVDGAADYFARDGLHPPGAVLAAIDSYRADQNPLLSFWADCVVYDPDGKVQRSELRRAYKRHCESNGVRLIGEAAFVDRIRAYGATEAGVAYTNPETGARGTRRGWAGIRLRTDEDDEPQAPTPWQTPPNSPANDERGDDDAF